MIVPLELILPDAVILVPTVNELSTTASTDWNWSTPSIFPLLDIVIVPSNFKLPVLFPSNKRVESNKFENWPSVGLLPVSK